MDGKKYAKQNAKHRLLNLVKEKLYIQLFFLINIEYNISTKGK